MKKIIKSLDDVFYYTAKECNVNQDLVEHVHSNLWAGIRYFLSHPLECGKVLMLNTLLKFTISESKTYTYLKRLREGTGHVPEFKKDLGFYEKLFELAAGETYDSRINKIKERNELKEKRTKQTQTEV